jgi:hypothetical protein
MAAWSMFPRQSAEPSQHANAIFYDSAIPVSPTHWSSQTRRLCVCKDAVSGMEKGRLGDDANRQQFRVALLENCSFFADLVLRQVRAESNQSCGRLEQDASRKKLSVASLTSPKASVLKRPPSEETALPPKMSSSLLPTLWVEVGYRHARTLVSEKDRP